MSNVKIIVGKAETGQCERVTNINIKGSSCLYDQKKHKISIAVCELNYCKKDKNKAHEALF